MQTNRIVVSKPKRSHNTGDAAPQRKPTRTPASIQPITHIQKTIVKSQPRYARKNLRTGRTNHCVVIIE